MKSVTLLVRLVLALNLVFAGCANPDDANLGDGAGERIRRGNIEGPNTLDPALAEDVHAFNILIDLYEGLVAEDASGRLIPGTAASWTVSGDGLTYTFEIRATARWSNGDRVVADDFVNGLRRVSAPETLSGYSFLLQPIENFADVHDGTTSPEALGVWAVDDSTLVIRLSRPSAHFLGVLAMPVAFPIHASNTDRTRFHDPGSFVGNGAYVLARRDVAGSILLQRNTRYWDAQSVQVAEVEYLAIADEIAELNLFRAGDLDITGTIPPSHIDIVRQVAPSEVRIAPSLALYYLAFDLTEPPLDNRQLRMALSLAIDRDRLVALLGRGERAAYSVVPPGVANYQGAEYSWRVIGRDDRHQQAIESFKRAGYEPDNPLRIKLTYDVGGVHEQVALAISAMWHDVLGVETTLDKKEWKYFLDTRNNRTDWQVMRFSWFGDYNDASTFTDIFHSGSRQNLPRFADPEYDSAVQQAAAELSPQKRSESLRRAEELLLEAYAIAPLYFYVSKHMVRSDVRGFEENVLDRHPSKYLYFSTDKSRR